VDAVIRQGKGAAFRQASVRVKKNGWSVWFCVGLCAAVPAWSEEAPPEAAVVIPEVDIADSVRRMLEAARLEQEAAAAEVVDRSPDSLPAATAPVAPVAPPPVVATPPVQPPPVPPTSSARAVDHVPLPEREFTIRSLDDIRELARELDEAKRRQKRQE